LGFYLFCGFFACIFHVLAASSLAVPMTDSVVPGDLSTASVHTLYREHHGWLLGWLRQRLQGAEHAADLAQDTFVRVLGHRERLPTLREPRAWLSAIARGLVIDHWRRQDLERAWLETLAQRPETQAPSPEEQQLVLELLEQLCRMVEGLRPAVRQAFLLHRVEGLRQAEIAARLGVTLRSVERYLAEAMYHCYQLRHGDGG